MAYTFSMTVHTELPAAILFYIRAEDKHSYTSVNDLVLQNIIYCPGAFETQCKLAGADSRLFRERNGILTGGWAVWE
ncbi:HTH-type transcriptional activator RhaR [Salmonella enterica subsp. arizonae]|uniref:HTH-type transcriptional activator RhaR n=1 Tax=Salmonella enterica subsp. arizonae TaxID=59203 RepID=A0A379SDL7_SALER|nr:HTH-type transcriptional activator RhaR [Salmonella enterica subsp. arizonae]